MPQKKLQKLAYLAEIEYIKKHGERLTDLSFKRYYFGPYSDDIRNIEDLDENIIVSEVPNGSCLSKESKLSNPGNIEPIKSKALQKEIHSLIRNHARKSGNTLETVADSTEPYLETDKLNDPIDLDGYAWYCSKVIILQNSGRMPKRQIRKMRKITFMVRILSVTQRNLIIFFSRL
ncbi:MAG: type II toxin-antitoxin system antitoxin SocA domain-containing protein [Thermoplasmataceae archaeon]